MHSSLIASAACVVSALVTSAINTFKVQWLCCTTCSKGLCTTAGVHKERKVSELLSFLFQNQVARGMGHQSACLSYIPC